MDVEGRLKNATAGGGLRDMPLDRTSLDIAWDKDPGFDEELASGLARLQPAFAQKASPGEDDDFSKK